MSFIFSNIDLRLVEVDADLFAGNRR